MRSVVFTVAASRTSFVVVSSHISDCLRTPLVPEALLALVVNTYHRRRGSYVFGCHCIFILFFFTSPASKT